MCQVEVSAHLPLAREVHREPIWMLFGYATVFSYPVSVHPQTPQHPARVNPVAEWLQTLRKALERNTPITNCLPPAGFGRSIPACVNEKDLGAGLDRGVDGVVQPVGRDLKLGTDFRLNPCGPATGC